MADSTGEQFSSGHGENSGEVMTPDLDRDEEALAMREKGGPFAGIAHILELDDARAANSAFNRALRRQSSAEQTWLRGREMARLDASARRLRGRDDLSAEELVRRLRGLQHQRKTLFVA